MTAGFHYIWRNEEYRKLSQMLCVLILCSTLLAGCTGVPASDKKDGAAANTPTAGPIVYDRASMWKAVELLELGTLAVPETGEGSKARPRKFLAGDSGEKGFCRLYDQVASKEGQTDGDDEVISYGIARYDLSGNLLESQALPEWRTEDGGLWKVNDAAQRDGSSYLLTNDKLAVITPDGKRTEFESEGYPGELVSAGDILFLAKIGGGQTVFCRPQENGLQESIVIPVEGEKFYATGDLEKDGFVYLSRGNQLFCYDAAKGETSLVLEWDSSGILSTSLLAILSADEETIRILCYEKEKIIIKTLKPTTDKDGRIVLTVMTNDDSKIFRDTVYAFNQSNERYRVELVSPLGKPGVDASLEDWEEARTRVQLLLTTPEAPDLLDLGFLQNWESYAGQDAFEDLTPYLEASNVLDAKLYLPSVLACGQAAGKQVFLPRAFYMKMLYGQEQYLGTACGWTLRDFLNLREEHRDIPIFPSSNSAEGVLYKLLGMSMDEFVDAERNTCDFCNPLFYDLLACAAYEDTFTGEEQLENHGRAGLLNGKALLDETVIMDEFFYLWCTNVTRTGGIRLTVKGYPSKDGESSGVLCATHGDGVWISGFCNLAISRMGSQKEGAWEFIEFVQEYEPDYGLSGFPARKDRLERNMRTWRYTQKEMNGEPLREYTTEDMERLTEIIGNLSHKTSQDELLLKIVGEEAQVYFRGQKSAEETAQVIQNRVQLYLWENQ